MSAAVDDADLVLVAATALDTDPNALLALVDVAALERVVAAAELTVDPVDTAAALLVDIVRQRPFPHGNVAVAWLAAVQQLRAADLELRMTDAAAMRLLRAVEGGAGEADVAAVLARSTSTRPGALRRLATALVRADTVDGQLWPCPGCGRAVEVREANVGGLRPGSVAAQPTLLALCASQHGVHDRRGRPNDGADDSRAVVELMPVLA